MSPAGPSSISNSPLTTAGTVSLLTDFEVAANLDDWEIGVHGVWIDFIDMENRHRNAVYLPDVASEQGSSPQQQPTSIYARWLTFLGLMRRME